MFGKKRKSESPSAPVQAIVKLLDEHPEDWAFGEHYATHIGGATIWIANPHLVWARCVVVPGIGQILKEGEGCKVSIDHTVINTSVFRAQSAVYSSKMREYLVRTESAKGRRIRELGEGARRMDYNAESLTAAAQDARALAAEKRAQLQTISPTQSQSEV